MIRPVRRSVFRGNAPPGRTPSARLLLQRHRRALLDVAEPGAGPGRLDPDRHQRAGFLRRRRRQHHGFLESRASLITWSAGSTTMVAAGRAPPPRRCRAPWPRRCRAWPVRPRYFPAGNLSAIRGRLSPGRHWSGRECARAEPAREARDRFLEQGVLSETKRSNCLGRARRLSGQKRSPLPPARMSA